MWQTPVRQDRVRRTNSCTRLLGKVFSCCTGRATFLNTMGVENTGPFLEQQVAAAAHLLEVAALALAKRMPEDSDPSSVRPRMSSISRSSVVLPPPDTPTCRALLLLHLQTQFAVHDVAAERCTHGGDFDHRRHHKSPTSLNMTATTASTTITTVIELTTDEVGPAPRLSVLGLMSRP